MNKIIKGLLVFFTIWLLSGCTDNKNISTPKQINNVDINTKPYKFKYKPIVGSRHSDARVIVDNGVILKAWINSYKNKYGSLIASHDIYVRARQPDFVANYATLPKSRKNRGLFSSSNKLPFMLSSKEIDRTNIKTNKAIKDYVNSYESKEDAKISSQRLVESNKYDNDIKEYLSKKRKDKVVEKSINKAK